MLQEHQLISKILDEKDYYVTRKYSITSEDFVVLPDVFEFIEQYAKENKGLTPDYRTVVAEFDTFEYYPEVSDTFAYLCKTLKNNSAKRQMFLMLQKEAPVKFNELKGTEFTQWIIEEASNIQKITDAKLSQGSNFATNGQERLLAYEESKQNGSNIFVPTPYDSLTKAMAGGNELGDYMLLMAYTNRGKSWIAADFGLAAWKADFGVMHYSPELSKKQTMGRLDTLMGHFDNKKMRVGQLENEDYYKHYLKSFNEENNTVPYIVKSMDDLDNGLTLDTIEADIMANPDIKVVIIDGFNLVTHKGKEGQRNNMTQTSRQLRQIFGKHQVLGIVVHHTNTESEKSNKEVDEVGNRTIKAPTLEQYSETIAVVQDACTVFTFDAYDGMGVLAVRKARLPIIDMEIPLALNLNMGYIREVDSIEEELPF